MSILSSHYHRRPIIPIHPCHHMIDQIAKEAVQYCVPICRQSVWILMDS